MIIKKASQKVHVLARITLFMCISKRKSSINAFSKLNLATVHLYESAKVVWLKNRIDRPHKKCIKIIYNNQMLSFVNLLAKNGSITTPKQNLCVLVPEMSKV